MFTSVSFNQDSSCFIAGRVDGFSIFTTNPAQEIVRRTFSEQFGVKVCAMHYKTSLIAFTGERTDLLAAHISKYPKFQHLREPIGFSENLEQKFYPNVVYLFDDAEQKFVGRLRFASEVHSIKFRNNCIAVSLLHQIYLHSLADLSLIDVVNTADFGPQFGLSTIGDDFLLAYVTPGVHGRVGLNFYLQSTQKIQQKDTKSSNKEQKEMKENKEMEMKVERRFMDCHKSQICALNLSENGLLLTTASNKSLRCFDTSKQQLLQAWDLPDLLFANAIHIHNNMVLVLGQHRLTTFQLQTYQIGEKLQLLEGSTEVNEVPKGKFVVEENWEGGIAFWSGDKVVKMGEKLQEV